MDEAGGFEAEKRKVCPRGSDFKWIDQFPYYPTYRYHPYRSQIGACFSLLAGFIFFVRLVSSTINWFDLPPVVTEAREQFARDPTDTYELPRIGVQFRQNGWKPFNDPRYIAITFDQGVIQKSGNVTYTSLGGKECSFIDKDGRLIADDARCASGRVAGSAARTAPQRSPRASSLDRCPSASDTSETQKAYLQGDFHDVTFAFVRARLIRCNNGTDIEGKPLPGMCMMPSEIDRLVYNGVLYLFEQEEDMRVNDLVPFMRIRQWRREFVSGLHLSTDVYFTIRQVIRDARFIFDAYLPGFQSGLSFMLLDDYQETYTDFDEDAAQYSAFYFRLSREMVVQVNACHHHLHHHRHHPHLAHIRRPPLLLQRRSNVSLFALFEAWGAIGFFLYLVFGLTAIKWNTWRFNRQVRGLDIRKLDRDQFTPFGRLIDKSFQMPREYQDMSAGD